MKLPTQLFKKNRIKYPKRGWLLFYKNEGIWYAYLSYHDESLEDIPLGEDLFLDDCNKNTLMSYRVWPYKYSCVVELYFSINKESKRGFFFRLELDNETPNESTYIVTGSMKETLGHSGHRLAICEYVKALYKGCPQSLFVDCY